MANPIPYAPVPPAPAEQLEADTLKSQAALSETLALLRELHERGGLDLAAKLLEGGPNLTAATLQKLNEPGVIQGLRNVIILAETLGKIDPEELQLVAGALGQGVHTASEAILASKRVGLRRTFSNFQDEDVQLALNAGIGLLSGLGQGMRQQAAAHIPTPAEPK